MSGSMSGVWRRSHGRTSEAPPERKGRQQICSTYSHRATPRLYPLAAVLTPAGHLRSYLDARDFSVARHVSKVPNSEVEGHAPLWGRQFVAEYLTVANNRCTRA